MLNHHYQPILFRTALLLVCVALLPIAVGALVTTMHAGMAFYDWPSSDGYGMLSYPWLKSAGDKFVEHGHRLAGMLVGIVTIIFTVVFFRKESRLWMKACVVLILLAVIVQGLLGGARVLQDQPKWALVHFNFAAIVFTGMVSIAFFSSKSWFDSAERFRSANSPTKVGFAVLLPLAFLVPLAIYGQMILGGIERHFYIMRDRHVEMALLVTLCVLTNLVIAWKSGYDWLRRPATLLAVLVLSQGMLGAGAWLTKYGWPPAGYVAEQGSVSAKIVQSTHAIAAMFLLATSVVYLLRVVRLNHLMNAQPQISHLRNSSCQTSLTVGGGVS